MKKYFLYFLILIGQTINAQSEFNSLNIVVKDAEDSALIPFASVQLYMEDTLVDAASTDFNGKIEFDSLKLGTYDVQIQLVGYQTKRVAGVKLGIIDSDEMEVNINKGLPYCPITICIFEPDLIKIYDNTTETTFDRETIRRMPY